MLDQIAITRRISFVKLVCVLTTSIFPFLNLQVKALPHRLGCGIHQHCGHRAAHLHKPSHAFNKSRANRGGSTSHWRSAHSLRDLTFSLSSLGHQRTRAAHILFSSVIPDRERTSHLHYTSALEDKRVYHAVLDETNVLLIVKYTLRYSKVAHNHTSKLAFAPKLFGIERDGW